jgi:hypothetical protein
MSDADDILARMQNVRRHVGDDVHDLVQTAKKLSDWRYHVKSHPWACVGAAFAAGFLIVPKRREPPSEQTKELVALLKKHNIGLPAGGFQPSKGLGSTILAAAVPFALRAGMSLVNQRFSAGSKRGAGSDLHSRADYKL